MDPEKGGATTTEHRRCVKGRGGLSGRYTRCVSSVKSVGAGSCEERKTPHRRLVVSPREPETPRSQTSLAGRHFLACASSSRTVYWQCNTPDTPFIGPWLYRTHRAQHREGVSLPALPEQPAGRLRQQAQARQDDKGGHDGNAEHRPPLATCRDTAVLKTGKRFVASFFFGKRHLPFSEKIVSTRF